MRPPWNNIEIEIMLNQRCVTLSLRCFNVTSTLYQRRTALKVWRQILFHFQLRINLFFNVEMTLTCRLGQRLYEVLHMEEPASFNFQLTSFQRKVWYQAAFCRFATEKLLWIISFGQVFLLKEFSSLVSPCRSQDKFSYGIPPCDCFLILWGC